jgi:purine-binding chemotaxis protein CheW
MKTAPQSTMDRPDTVSLCSVRVGSELFAIDTRLIREVVGGATPQRVPLAPEYIAGVVHYRGEVLTTVSFRALLGLEQKSGTSCVLVFDDEQTDERFGLMVDAVGGVMALARSALEANPSTLDARSMALFDGAYRMQSGLMVRLDPQRLRPSQLARRRLFGVPRPIRTGEPG